MAKFIELTVKDKQNFYDGMTVIVNVDHIIRVYPSATKTYAESKIFKPTQLEMSDGSWLCVWEDFEEVMHRINK